MITKRSRLVTVIQPTKELSYSQHQAVIMIAFESIGLHTKAKTHVMRGAGARMDHLVDTQ